MSEVKFEIKKILAGYKDGIFSFNEAADKILETYKSYENEKEN